MFSFSISALFVLRMLQVFLCLGFTDNQECGDSWRDDEDRLPGHENLTENDVELFRRIQELALQVQRARCIIRGIGVAGL